MCANATEGDIASAAANRSSANERLKRAQAGELSMSWSPSVTFTRETSSDDIHSHGVGVADGMDMPMKFVEQHHQTWLVM